MYFNEVKAWNKWGKHCKLRTMKGICCYVKLTKIKHKILNPERGGGGGEGIKRPAPFLGPPFVISISFRHFEVFCLFLRVKCAIFKLHLQFFNTRIPYSRHLEKMAAISRF